MPWYKVNFIGQDYIWQFLYSTCGDLYEERDGDADGEDEHGENDDTEALTKNETNS